MPLGKYRGAVESEPKEVDVVTEALEPVRLDPVASRIEQWATEANQAPGGNALRDIDALEYLLDLTGSHPAGMAQLYGGRVTKLSALIRDTATFASARSVLSKIDQEKQTSLARFGLYPTYLVMGVASWTQLPPFREEERGTRPDLSHFKLQHFNLPVLLRPLELEANGNDFTLKMGGALMLNPVLEHVFQQREVDFEPQKLWETSGGETGFDFQPALQMLRDLGQSHIPGFDLKENLLVANLGVSGAVLAADWHQVSAMALENPLVRAFAGDKAASAKLLEPLPETPPFDRDPDVERGIGDLDVSQARVIELVASGRSIFVEVPPGAPGSATIEAILADGAASGKQICYVPGVQRLGKAVLGGLKRSRLSDYVLDLTGSSEWRSSLRDQLLSAPANSQVNSPVPVEELARAHAKLRAIREKLYGYTERLHRVRQPWGVSAYTALQALADLTSAKPGPRTKVKLSLSNDEQFTPVGRERIKKLLDKAQQAGMLDPSLEKSPWRSVVLSTEVDATDAVSRVHDLAEGKLAKLRRELDTVSDQTGLVFPETLNAWKEQLGMLDGVAEILETFQPEVFEKSAADMVIATATSRWRQARSLPMKGKDRRALVKQARDLLRPEATSRNLHEDLVNVQSYRDLWRRHAVPGAWPRVPENLAEIKELSEEIFVQIKAIEPIIAQADGSKGQEPEAMALSELDTLLNRLDSTSDQARQMPAQVQLLKEIQEEGLEPLLEDLRERKVDPDLVPAELDLAWWSTVLTAIFKSDQNLAGTDGAAVHEMVTSLRALELAHIESLPYPVAQAISLRANQTLASNPEIAGLLQEVLVSSEASELGNFSRLVPLVKILRPIWALSPFVAGQLYGSEPIDLLVLDHLDHLSLSQVMPLVARAKQLVVSGDSHRGWGGFTKAAAGTLPAVSLRSDLGELPEQVAAFLAGHGYEDTVVPVPSPRPASLVNLHLVPEAQAPLSRDQSMVMSRSEIHQVVELCLNHALNRPSQSLAVVCFNAAAVPRIRKALADARVKIPQAQSFFSHPSGRPAVEPFVVVDSTQVAGLRRDVIILSLGMSKTPQGRVQLHFGPISGPSGVAHVVGSLEAVRQRLEIVSAFKAEEVDLKKVDSAGGKMLVELLESAGEPEGMARALTTPESFESEPDRLLVDLAERLWRQGLTVVPRFGLPDGIQIPLAIGHADLPSELLVAVLTDDENYVSEPSLRRRERLWPARLEAAGWKVITCYTNEVFADPQAQAQRVFHGLSNALNARKSQLSIPIIATPHFETEPEEGADSFADVFGIGEKQKDVAREDKSKENLESSGGLPVDEKPQSGTFGKENSGSEGLEESEELDTDSSGPARLHLVKKERGPRPPIAKGLPLAAYGDDQLDELLEWICSDDVERSEDEQVEELRRELEVSKRGAQVDAVLRHVVQRRNAAL